MIVDLHFLRPVYLIALLPIALLWWRARRGFGDASPPPSPVAAHLWAALTIRSDGRRRWTPADGLGLVLLSVVLAAAGPAWEREQAPWFAEAAPLIIALEVSESMLATDLPPSRLAQAGFKLRDLLEARAGSRTALIAYAGSAHIVMPFTADRAVISGVLESLHPRIMPLAGSNATAVLPLARELLNASQEGAKEAATLLFLNDGFEPADVPALLGFAETPGAPALAALVLGADGAGAEKRGNRTGQGRAPPPDTELLRRLDRASALAVVRTSIDDGDLQRLQRHMASALRRRDDPQSRWRDEGWWLLWLAVPPALLWFRRGWTLPW